MSEVTPQTTELLDADKVVRATTRITHQIIEKTALDSPNAGHVVLLGILSGGVSLAEKLADLTEQFSGIRPETESLDIILYRDSLRKGPHRALQPTNASNSGINGITVVLINDVLFSGRAIRTAPDVTADIDHPRVTQLAVLVDRGYRQLPTHANCVDKNLPTSRDEDVDALVEALDGRDMVILIRAEER